MRAEFSHILENYSHWHSTLPFARNVQTQSAFKSAEASIQSLLEMSQRREVRVRFSYGKGNWTGVPWISIDPFRRKKTSAIGVHIFYLFREDQTGFYLTYTQGVAELEGSLGIKVAREEMLHLKEALKPTLTTLLDRNFELNSFPDFHSSSPRATGFRAANIAHRFYPREAIPEQHVMVEDLIAALDQLNDTQRLYMSLLYERLSERNINPERLPANSTIPKVSNR